MKKILMICLLLITIIACKKKTTTTAKVNNTVSTAYVSPLTGTWVNSTDVTDYFTIHDTIYNNPNCHTCKQMIVITHGNRYFYSGTATDTLILKAPGATDTFYDPNSMPDVYTDHVYYTGGIIKIQIDQYPINNTNPTTRIFNKQ